MIHQAMFALMRNVFIPPVRMEGEPILAFYDRLQQAAECVVPVWLRHAVEVIVILDETSGCYAVHWGEAGGVIL